MQVIKSILKGWSVLPLSAVVIFLLTELGSRNPAVIENIYSQNFYPFIANIISNISNIFPFSLDDLLYVLLIISFLSILFLFIRKKLTFKKTIIIIVNVVAIIYIHFYLFWGFNYYREAINARLSLTEGQTNTEAFINQLEKMIKDANHTYCRFDGFDMDEIDELVEESYQKLSSILKLSYPAGKRKDKKITFSTFFAKAGISGYYGPFFNEVHVNKKVLPVEYPFVLAHEKAHQFGITSEAEANFYAWLVCTHSGSKELQYSANLHILRFFLYQGYQLEEYPELISKLDENVRNDLIAIREHWAKLRNDKVNKAASKVNDTYLKTNKVEKGIEDYRGVVKYIMDFSQDSIFQKKCITLLQ